MSALLPFISNSFAAAQQQDCRFEMAHFEIMFLFYLIYQHFRSILEPECQFRKTNTNTNDDSFDLYNRYLVEQHDRKCE